MEPWAAAGDDDDDDNSRETAGALWLIGRIVSILDMDGFLSVSWRLVAGGPFSRCGVVFFLK